MRYRGETIKSAYAVYNKNNGRTAYVEDSCTPNPLALFRRVRRDQLREYFGLQMAQGVWAGQKELGDDIGIRKVRVTITPLRRGKGRK